MYPPWLENLLKEIKPSYNKNNYNKTNSSFPLYKYHAGLRGALIRGDWYAIGRNEESGELELVLDGDTVCFQMFSLKENCSKLFHFDVSSLSQLYLIGLNLGGYLPANTTIPSRGRPTGPVKQGNKQYAALFLQYKKVISSLYSSPNSSLHSSPLSFSTKKTSNQNSNPLELFDFPLIWVIFSFVDSFHSLSFRKSSFLLSRPSPDFTLQPPKTGQVKGEQAEEGNERELNNNDKPFLLALSPSSFNKIIPLLRHPFVEATFPHLIPLVQKSSFLTQL